MQAVMRTSEQWPRSSTSSNGSEKYWRLGELSPWRQMSHTVSAALSILPKKTRWQDAGRHTSSLSCSTRQRKARGARRGQQARRGRSGSETRGSEQHLCC